MEYKIKYKKWDRKLVFREKSLKAYYFLRARLQVYLLLTQKEKKKKKSSATQKEKKKKKKIKCMDRKALTSTYLLEECINMARIFLDYSLNLFP